MSDSTPFLESLKRQVLLNGSVIFGQLILNVAFAIGRVAFLLFAEAWFPYFMRYVLVFWRMRSMMMADWGVPSNIASISPIIIIFMFFGSMFPPLQIIWLARMDEYLTSSLALKQFDINAPYLGFAENMMTLVHIFRHIVVLRGLMWLAPNAPEPDLSGTLWKSGWLTIALTMATFILFTMAVEYHSKNPPQGFSGAIGPDIILVLYRGHVLLVEWVFQLRAYLLRFLLERVQRHRGTHQRKLEAFPTFKHAHLDADDQIRLIRTGIPLYDGTLKIQIIHVPLKSAPPFIACSYASGQSVLDHMVEVTSQSGQNLGLQVTKSTYDLLLREQISSFSEKLIWVDAICINQSNAVERAKQTAIMRSIFQKAEVVHVHLDSSLEPFHHHYEASQITRILCRAPNAQNSVVSMAYISPRDDFWLEMNELYGASWFNRVWSVQEAAVGKDIRFIYRTLQMNGDLFRDLTKTFIGLLSNQKPQTTMKDRFSERVPFKLVSNCIALSNIFDLRTRIKQGGKVEFSQCLMLGQKTTSPEPRDKIYALIGLVSEEMFQKLPVDYTIPVSQLYTQAMREVLRQSQDLDNLSAAGLDHLGSTFQTPTWVACWQDSSNQLERGIYSAATSQPWPGIGSSSIDEIEIPMCSIDTIELLEPYSELGDFMKDNADQMSLKKAREHIKKLVGLLRSRWIFTSFNAARVEYASTQGIKEVFWRTLLWDQMSNERRRTNADDEKIFKILEWAYGLSNLERPAPVENIDAISDVPPDLLRADLHNQMHWGSASVAYSSAQQLGITSSGRLGLFPKCTQVGDTVALFASANLPFVIRRSGQLSERYLLVGDCYVHGVMDGEAANGPWPKITLI